MSKGICICSGGLDSTVAFHFLKSMGHELLPVFFDYGSKHNSRERDHVEALFRGEVECYDIRLPYSKSALLRINPEEEIPEGHYEDKSMKRTVIPFRNGILLSFAVGLADARDMDFVAIGNHAGDHAIYPDCRPDFIGFFTEAAQVGTYNHITILSPFKDMPKSTIVETGISLGIEEEMAMTWSCYKGERIHCGKCGTCVERKEAFQLAGIKDETTYAE